MKHILHPIVGETKYGRHEHNVLFHQRFNCHRLLLHANKIKFVHLISKEILEIDAKIDEIFQRIYKVFLKNSKKLY